MSEPIAQLTELLKPTATLTKLVTGKGSWSVRREAVGRPFYCAVLQGELCLAIPNHPFVSLIAGDFVLLPSATRFETFSGDRKPGDRRVVEPREMGPGTFRLGEVDGDPDMRKLVGYGAFGSDDAALLTTFLPPIVHIRGSDRLATLVHLIDGETRSALPARTEMLTRLLEMLLIDALRSSEGPDAPAGLLRGLADERLARPLRAMHQDPGHAWSVDLLAREAGLSRSAFFSRFERGIGMPPMRYLLHWRMLLAKRLLLQDDSVSSVATQVGYSSGNTFSIAFTKYTRTSPKSYLQSCRQAALEDKLFEHADAPEAKKKTQEGRDLHDEGRAGERQTQE